MQCSNNQTRNSSSNINIKNDQIEFNRYGFIVISNIQNDIKDLDKILKFKKIL